MTARKLKNSWWVDFRVDHIRYRQRSPENSRTGAKAYELTLRHRLAQGQSIDRSPLLAEPGQSFESFAWTWFDDYVRANNKPSEQRTKMYILRGSLVPFFGKVPVREITTRQIEAYKAASVREGVSNKTINNRLAVLKKCLTTAYDWLALPDRPPVMKLLKCPPPTTSYLTQDDCGRLLAASTGIVHDMILVALRTGMRQGELKGLQWSSVDWRTATITVRHSKSDYSDELGSPKSNRERHIPMHQDVAAALWKRRRPTDYVFLNNNGLPFRHMRLAERLHRACLAAGLRPIGWHALRHTFASHLAMKGVPLGAVQALLGHSNITTTMRYAHMAPSVLRHAIDLLSLPDNDDGQPVGNPRLPVQELAQPQARN